MSKKTFVTPVAVSIVLAALVFCIAKTGTENPNKKFSEKEISAYLEKDLDSSEKSLGITKEARKSFVLHHGLVSYEIGISTAPYVVLSCTNAASPVKDSDLEAFGDKYRIDTFQIKSSLRDEHPIPADYITNGDYGKNTVIMVHGCGENRRKMPERAKMFLENGWNVLQYDQRSSGQNTAPFVTYGVAEQYDLFDCVQYVNEKTEGKAKIALFGSSMGCLTVCKMLSDNYMASYVSCAILDSPLTSLETMILPELRKNCPKDILPIAEDSFNRFTKVFYGFTFEDVNLRYFGQDITTPVLVFVTEKDDILNYADQKKAISSIPEGNKHVYTSKECGHCGFYREHHDDYVDLCMKLLDGKLVQQSQTGGAYEF